MYRPVIGITTTNLKALPGIGEKIPPSWVMSQRFLLAPTRAGGLPWMIPLLDDADDLRAVYERLDGVMIPGGADVDPVSYGERVMARSEGHDPPRDAIELQLVRWAVEDGKPVLGICRGIQLIALAHGGSLWQDLAEQVPGSVKHDYFPDQGFERHALAHDVEIEGASLLGTVLGARRLRVNSMHHQAVREVGVGVRITARAPEDGVIEGLEVPGHPFMVGVQWHPEALSDRDPVMRKLFVRFVEAAAAWRAGAGTP